MTVGTCPACGRASAGGAQTCSYCGEPLTSVARVISGSSAPRQPRWLAQNRLRANEIRKSEDHASQQRYEALVETDRRRLDSEAQVAARTAVRERRAVLLAAAVVGLIVVLALGLVLAAVL